MAVTDGDTQRARTRAQRATTLRRGSVRVRCCRQRRVVRYRLACHTKMPCEGDEMAVTEAAVDVQANGAQMSTLIQIVHHEMDSLLESGSQCDDRYCLTNVIMISHGVPSGD